MLDSCCCSAPAVVSSSSRLGSDVDVSSAAGAEGVVSSLISTDDEGIVSDVCGFGEGEIDDAAASAPDEEAIVGFVWE